MTIVVVLSGPVASGKSSLARDLAGRWDGLIVSTRHELADQARSRGVDLAGRRDFQNFGDTLDDESDGEWVVRAALAHKEPEARLLVVDAVRRQNQINALRRVFGRSLVHVHLATSDRQTLANRYRQRRDDEGTFKELETYDEVVENPTEAQVWSLGDHADVVLDTLRNTPKDLLVRCEARLGLLPSIIDPLVDVLVGGQYGSEGKGNIAYYLAPEYETLVRVGGPNAGHKIKHDGVEYTHRSLPSGALANPRANLIIGPGAVVSEAVLRAELKATNIAPSRIKIDPQVMIITDEDLEAERELKKSIQSTGQGVGSAAARRILGRGQPGGILARDHENFSEFIAPTADLLHTAFEKGGRVLVEGTQGTGLSLYHGVFPYVTSRDTTVAGTLAEVGIGPRRVRRAIMVARTYPIRVNGPSGPMGEGKELKWSDIEERSGVSDALTKELSSVSNKQRRVAEFDWSMLRRSAELNSATDIALTFTDYISVENRKAYRYEQLTPETLQFVEEVESVTGATASLIATAFSERGIIDRRTWRAGQR